VTNRTLRIGRDRVEVRGDTLTVITRVQNMEGWQVSRYRASVIHFDGQTWRVTKHTVGSDRLSRYELARWDPSNGELTGPRIDYSSDDVVLRDYRLQQGRRRSRVTFGLNLIGPLTGLLPAPTKDQLETRYGIDPVASTKASVLIQMLLVFVALTLAPFSQMVRLYGLPGGFTMFLVLTVALVLGVDAVVRWSQVLAEVRPPSGFYEWLFTRPGKQTHRRF